MGWNANSKSFVVILLVLTGLLSTSWAQPADTIGVRPNEDAWKKAIEGVSFQEELPEPQESSEISSGWDPDFDFSGISGILRVLAYSALIGLAVWIIWLLIPEEFKRNNLKLKNRRKPSFADLDEDIRETDLERLLRMARDQNNKPLIIRIYFLMILKNLDGLNRIEWQKDKTNHEYVREMYQDKDRLKFRRLTRVFEHVWYGEKAIEAEDFDAVEPLFASFINETAIPAES